MIFSSPVPGDRIIPYGEERQPGEDRFFRVTQRFTDVNPRYPELGQHGAIDLGNFLCGDPVFAAAAGRARTTRDSAGANIVIIDHGNGWTTVYAHLATFAIVQGATVTITRGQKIGTVGMSGLGGVCHLHFETKLNGTKVDPWPLLEQNQEDDMKLQGTFLAHVFNRRTTVFSSLANFRAGVTLDAPTLAQFAVGTIFYPVVQVSGAAVGTNAIWYGGFLWVSGSYVFGYFHSSVLADLVTNEAASPQELLKAKRLGAVGAAGAAQKYADSL